MHAPLVTRSGCRPPQTNTQTHTQSTREGERETRALHKMRRGGDSNNNKQGENQCSASSRPHSTLHSLLVLSSSFTPSFSLSISLYMYIVYTALWLHKSSLISTSPPSQWLPLPPLTARPHLENCNFHAKLVHAAQLASLPALRRQRRRRLRNLAQGQLATH